MKRHPKKIMRQKSSRNPPSSVLIVTEGEKTEPRYFEAVCKKLQITSVNIDGNAESDPTRLVNHAKRKREDAVKNDTPFDRVFCVFDKNGHSSFVQAVKKCNKLEFNAITSVPCFEYWLLLHYEFTDRPFGNCPEAEDSLRKHYPGYHKGGDLSPFMKKLDDAIKNAKQCKQSATVSDFHNPSTTVHELMEYLMASNALMRS